LFWFIGQLISRYLSFFLIATNTLTRYFSPQGFNIYVNGAFHCCLRYKQLHSLHEQLRRSLMNLSLPQFPPKKLLTLTKSELEQRRLALERYLQLSMLGASLISDDL
jgi:sorting nexin-17